jgi:hypothetical protein
MFDLITRKVQHAPRHQAVSVLVSIATQVSIAGAILAGTLIFVTSPDPRESSSSPWRSRSGWRE